MAKSSVAVVQRDTAGMMANDEKMGDGLELLVGSRRRAASLTQSARRRVRVAVCRGIFSFGSF
jgi:hypothetical protein